MKIIFSISNFQNSPTAGQYVSEGMKFQSFRVSQVIHDAIVEYFDTGELDPDIPPLGVSISKVGLCAL